MNDRTKIEILRDEITIPRIVQQKADAAYAMLREDNVARDTVLPENETGKGLHNIIQKKKVLIWVAVAVMLTAGLSVAAGVRWNQALSGKWQVEESERESLQKEGAVSFVMQSQTQNGVTITAQQSVTDNYSVYVGFQIDGYVSEENLSPEFEEIVVTVDGMDGANYSAGFYEEEETEENGSLSYWISMTEMQRGSTCLPSPTEGRGPVWLRQNTQILRQRSV